jgi:hypothetical protein
MDPLTASLHDCSHQFIPHLLANHGNATIRVDDSYYTITITKLPIITKLPDSPTSVLGKRCHSDGCKEYKKNRRLTDNNPLYNTLGHNFE